VGDAWRDAATAWQKYVPATLWLLGVWGISLSLSRGGYLGLLAAVLAYLFFYYRKYLLWSMLATAVVVLVASGVSANFRYRLLLPFHGEKSTVSRFSLWSTASRMIADKPLLGQGITGFHTQWDKFNRDPNLQPYNFPHNIVLNAWVNFGALGAASFMSFLLAALYAAWHNRRQIFGAALGLFVIALVVHGLVDIPYFKNDLALIFWVIFGASTWKI
jgi:O-antigen ligase